MRGKVRQGLASSPSRDWRAWVSSRSTRSNERENLSRISCCHCLRSEAGVMTSTRRMRRRRSSSVRMRPASTVLPRPTSSASRSETRGIWSALSRGTSWKSSTCTAPKKGEAMGSSAGSAEISESGRTKGVSALQRVARTRASKSAAGMGGCSPTRGMAVGSSRARWRSRSQRSVSSWAPSPSVYSTRTRWSRPSGFASKGSTATTSPRRLRTVAIMPTRGLLVGSLMRGGRLRGVSTMAGGREGDRSRSARPRSWSNF